MNKKKLFDILIITGTIAHFIAFGLTIYMINLHGFWVEANSFQRNIMFKHGTFGFFIVQSLITSTILTSYTVIRDNYDKFKFKFIKYAFNFAIFFVFVTSVLDAINNIVVVLT